MVGWVEGRSEVVVVLGGEGREGEGRRIELDSALLLELSAGQQSICRSSPLVQQWA